MNKACWGACCEELRPQQEGACQQASLPTRAQRVASVVLGSWSCLAGSSRSRLNSNAEVREQAVMPPELEAAWERPPAL